MASTPGPGLTMSVLGGLVLVVLAGHLVRGPTVRWRVPPAVSLLLLGVVLGPSVLDLLPGAYRGITMELAGGAFVVLLLRAGLGISTRVLRAVLVPSLLFGIVPVLVEIGCVAGLVRVTGILDDGSLALLAGFLVAAVSPAVILPTMLEQKDAGRGGPRHVPDRIMGQTVVNAVVAKTGILLMIAVVTTGVAQADPEVTLGALPLSVLGGAALGLAAGRLLPVDALTRAGPRARVLVATVLVVALALDVLAPSLRLEGIAVVLTLGVVLRQRLAQRSEDLRNDLRAVWSVAEIILFVNLGSKVDVSRLSSGGLVATALVVLACGVAVRVGTSWLLAARTRLNRGERAYVSLAQIPKATIQAVFGAAPLAAFQAGRPDLVGDGQTLLILAVLAIVATAPLGALALDRLGARCLVDDAPDRDSQRDPGRRRPSRAAALGLALVALSLAAGAMSASGREVSRVARTFVAGNAGSGPGPVAGHLGEPAPGLPPGRPGGASP